MAEDRPVALDDARLLRAFVKDHDEGAFEALVGRHGGMVLGVCRRLLNDANDAEDAAQATFMVLAAKASALLRHHNLGGWLHGVARRVARRARDASMRRFRHERQAATEPARNEPRMENKAWERVRSSLDEQLNALPLKFREPLVLFHFENRSLTECAAAVGCSPAAIGQRLSRGRAMLRDRLVQRGSVVSVTLLESLLAANASPAALPSGFAAASVKAATLVAAGAGVPATGAASSIAVSEQACSLAKGVVQTMYWKSAGMIGGVAAMFLVGAMGLYVASGAPQHIPNRPAAGSQEETGERKKNEPTQEAPPWEANPFAGTKALVVQHGERRHEIKDAAVVKALLARLRIIRIANDVHLASKATCRLEFQRGQKGSFNVSLSPGGVFMCRAGSIYVTGDFIRALNGHVSKAFTEQVDLLKFRLPKGPKIPKLTRDMLAGGYEHALIQYEVGDKPREIKIVDAEDLRALGRSLKLVRELDRRDKGPKGFSTWGEVNLKTRAGPSFWARFYGPEKIRTSLGRFQVDPAFRKEIERIVGKVEGRAIDLLKDNPPAPRETQSAVDVGKLMKAITSFEILKDRYGGKVNEKMDAAATKKALKRLEFVLGHPLGFARTEGVPAGMEILARTGEKSFRITFLKRDAMPQRVLLASPISIEGVGLAWVDDDFQYAFSSHLRDTERKREWRRQVEVTGKLMADFPRFLKQVRSVSVQFESQGDTLISPVTGSKRIGTLRAWLEIKAKEKKTVDPSHLKGKRFDPVVTLTPGLGFDLVLFFTSDHEALLPGWGKLTFKKGTSRAIRQLAGGKDQPDPDDF